jgi:hypothetical protein
MKEREEWKHERELLPGKILAGADESVTYS